MLKFTLSVFTENLFIPHGDCYLWKAGLVWLNIVSDSLIAIAYYCIAITLVYFVQKRRDLLYSGLFLLFSAFIIACGTIHIMDVWTLWHPTYWLSSFLKAFTALVSVYTAVTLVPVIPQAIALPSPLQLEAANGKLEDEIMERSHITEKLRSSQQMLQLVMDNIPQYIFWKDRNSVYLGCNRSFARVAGLNNPEEIVGKTDYDLPWKPEETEWFRESDARVIGTDTPEYHIIEPQLQADGKQAWVNTNKIPLHDSEGKVIGIIGTVEDITERKLAEEALCELNAELEERVQERTAQHESANLLLVGQTQVLEMLATGASLPDVLDVLTRTIEAHSPEMLGSILLLDPNGQNLRHAVAPSLPEKYKQAIDGVAIGPMVGSCGTAAYLGQPVITSDIASDLRWVDGRELALNSGLRACWSQPIFSSRGKVLGTFAVYYREPRRPSLKDLVLVETAAHIAGIAIERKQIEQERIGLVAILEASTDYIGTTDPQGNALWNNAQMKKLFGLNSDADVTNLRIPNYHPLWALEVVQNQGLPAAIRDGIWVGETALLRHDGVEIPVSQMIIAHKSPDGSVEYFSTIMHDISNRKQAQAALQASYNLLRTVLDSTPDGIFVKDLQGRYQLINSSFARRFNKSIDDIIGQDCSFLFPPELSTRMTVDDQRVINSGKSETYEQTVVIQGGSRTYMTTKSVYRDSKGNILGLVGFSRDITYLKQTQEALRQANEELELRVQARTAALSEANQQLQQEITERKVLERELVLREELLNAFFDAASLANVGLNILDDQLRFLRINQALAEINGAPVEAHMGKTVKEILPEIAPTILPLLQQVLLTGKPIVNQEVRGEVPSVPGVNRDWLVSYFPIVGENTTFKRVGTIVIEISKRKEAERKLQAAIAELTRSNQELEQFAYVASHDLREPLRKIKSYTDLLAKRYSGQLDDKADKYIAYISDGAVRMQALITDLLTYSRVGKGELTKEPTNLEAVLEQTLTDLSRAISESNAVITANPLPTVNANPRQMGQLLQNLIANALKFRGEQPPQIQIRAVLHDPLWTISVQDNGIGIEPRNAERIFVIFQRLHTKEEYPGTGIGLAVCQKIVERHGGQIWIESELGRGTTFFFTLPAG